jgi:peroxiredoxin-like protein
MEAHNYNVNLTWTGERKGTLSSPELNTSIEVATPPQFPKGIEGVWSPEHFYTAAISSCLMTTFLSIAEFSKLEFKSFSCEASGVLDTVDGKMLMTEVHLKPTVVLGDESLREKAEKILHKSEAACLISNSVKAKVTMTPNIIIQ